MKITDIHTHGIGGFDTRGSTVEDILRIAEIHGASGISEIVLSIYSAPIRQMRQQMELVRLAMEKQGHWSQVKGQGGADAARILGVHLEGPFLNSAQCGALDAASFVDPRERTFRELVDGFEDIVKTVTVAPERQGALALIGNITELGILVSLGHSDATYAEAEAGFRAGARSITHLFNAMRGFHHREPGLIGFGLLNREVYVEVIADPFHLHIKTLELIFRTKNPARIILVSDSVRETKTAGGEGIADVSGRLRGGAMTITGSSNRLVQLGFDKTTITKAIALNPRQYLMLNP
jgi:N-acetylglucosamine-6-phosphate deacetylase